MLDSDAHQTTLVGETGIVPACTIVGDANDIGERTDSHDGAAPECAVDFLKKDGNSDAKRSKDKEKEYKNR